MAIHECKEDLYKPEHQLQRPGHRIRRILSPSQMLGQRSQSDQESPKFGIAQMSYC